MPNNDLAIRFTEERYATKSEVARDLRISSVDAFWNNIQEYRRNFFHITPLKTIEKNTLKFCGCPSVNGTVNAVENKLLRVNRSFSGLFCHPTDVRFFQDRSLSLCLKYVADKYKLGLDENFCKTLVRNEIQQLDESVKPVKNYLDALDYVKTAHINNIDEDYLANLYSKIMGTTELTSFYRQHEDTNRENRVLIDRVYTCAPVSLIEPMMDSLFSFINNSTLSAGVKAAIVYFYVNYVRPFDRYSDEIALLMAKSIICHDSLGELGVLLPLESLLSEDPAELVKMITEVQKTSDLTYIVNYFFSVLDNCCNTMLDMMANLNTEQLRSDFYQVDEPVAQPQPKVEEVKEEVAPAIEETEISEEAIGKAEEPAPQRVSYVQEELAISYIPLALDEKQACLVEQDLLERDPSLRKGEAHFYARHCTKGKKYSIAQYKKAIGCVYETARTSMDHLAELGYYRKEKIKNKFVYVPIARN